MTNFLFNHGSFWMGLYCFSKDRSQCFWDDDSGTAISYSNFASGYPNIGIGKCVYYSNPGGLWANGDCGELLPYVCELPPTLPDTCLHNYKNHCYYPLTGSSVPEAIEKCDELCATLASVHSPGENRFIASISPEITLLGGIASPGGYIWMDGTPTDYNNDDVYPLDYKNGPFLSMNPGTGDFFASDGSHNKMFVCKRPVGAPCSGQIPQNATYTFTSSSKCLNPGVIMAPAIISSPNYPKDYPADVFCSWGVSSTGSHRLRMTINAFDTEKNDDIVKIYDGEDDKSPLIGAYSGGPFKPFGFVTSGPSIYITFLSDRYYTFSGFTSTITPVF
uniref:CUB domain-containing protein n=1 Tax=Caenorhabditis tropicalis TaxID=1561998 RepID=A0A1I7TI91_9PELO